MIPVHSRTGNMALINGYRPEYGWEVVGLESKHVSPEFRGDSIER
jgi:hypothetical protein